MTESKAIAKVLKIHMNATLGSAFILACNTLGIGYQVHKLDQNGTEINYDLNLTEYVDSDTLSKLFETTAQFVNYSQQLKESNATEKVDSNFDISDIC